MNNIHLYIGNTEVEFTANPEILYTYQVDDLTNPTVVKNSFSKTITIKGTKSNNHLFGHYWNVERIQVGGGDGSNVYFNASKKMDFQLFVGSELYESGYVKLDEVRRVGGDYEYDITLYGGLGDFFYNLSTTDDGNEMKLSNLEFDKDIDFTINIDTVKTAWNSLKNGTDDKWQLINFMPAYNGKPEDFDSNKLLMDMSSTNLTKSKTEDGKTYKTIEGWVMAELPDEMTEWQTRDLRSYLQRPCIRMKEIINACCNPDNNGGYEVELDSDFFNEDNPYWENTWLSLPMIQALEYDSGEQTIQGASLLIKKTEGSAEGYMYQPLEFDMGEFPSSVMSSISVRATIDAKLSYPSTSYKWFWNKGGDSYHTGWACYGSLFCQLLAFNGDTVVGASDAYNLTSPIRHNGKLWYGNNDRYSGGHSFTPYMGKNINSVLGFFKSNGFVREDTTEAAQFTFTINNLSTNVTALKMCYYWGASKDKMDKADHAYSCFDSTKDTSWVGHDWGVTYYDSPSYMTMGLKSHNLKAVMGGTIGRTGTEVTKNLLLNTEASPCDYLLSYCKMFGLYFSKSPYEKKISIQTRKSFYNREKITDISKDIDYSKNVTITPIAFGSKFVEFNQEQDETQYAKEYLTTKGVAYGSKVLNTGYEFDSEKKQLLDNNVIKSAIEGLEKSKYFTCYNNDSKVRPFFGYGMKYNLYNGDDSIELLGTNAQGSNLLGINEDNNLKYYDTFPKLQFHDKSNEPTDGNNCLVFFSGFKNLTTGRANPVNYFITDDSYYQTQLNEGTPCWLFVSGNRDINGKAIARKVDELPVFERYLTDSNGTTVKRSLDFGTPQELFIPKYSIKEDTNIYSNFWKTYLEDLYDVNTKILTVYVRLKEKVGYDLLRQFYWFENAIWRINKITDWNIGLEDTTKVEFVKVQDLTGYTSVTQTKSNLLSLSASKYNIAPTGEKVNLTLTTQNGGDWRIVTNSKNLVLSHSQGTGNSTIQLTVPQTSSPSSPSYYTVTAIDNEGNTTTINLTQTYDGATRFTLSPSNLIVPADGGDYTISFNWVNQGDNDINNASFIGDVKGTVDLDTFSATISVTESDEPDTVISGKVLFDSDLYNGEVGIDQIPQSLSFGKDGGEYEFMYNYNTDVKYDYVPSWATMNGNKLTVLPNYYEVERTANMMIQNNNSFAYVRLHQEIGERPAQEIKPVTPTEVYFGIEGGTQYLNIQIPNSWRLTKVGDWFTTNVSNGDSASIVSIACGSNSDSKRTGTITVKNLVTGIEYVVTVTQIGEGDKPSISVTPTSIETDYNGGDYDITFTYANRNGDYVEIEGNGLTWTNIIWNGDVGTLKVTVPKNYDVETKTYVLTFSTSIGNLTVNILQGESLPYLITDKKGLMFDDDGGTSTITVTSNIDWNATSSEEWLIIEPSSGDKGTSTFDIVVNTNNVTSDRVGYIYLKYGSEVMETITITQQAFVEILSITPSSITFHTDGGNEGFKITSNTSWTIELNE